MLTTRLRNANLHFIDCPLLSSSVHVILIPDCGSLMRVIRETMRVAYFTLAGGMATTKQGGIVIPCIVKVSCLHLRGTMNVAINAYIYVNQTKSSLIPSNDE